jgi:hypothetical protein
MRERQWYHSGPVRNRLGALLLPAFLIVYTLFFLGTVDGRLDGDDHFALAHAGALLAGDRLNVDFFDPGVPLQVAISYLGQAATGSRPIAEVLIALTIRILGLIALYAVTKKLVGSRVAAVLVAMIVAVLLMEQAVYGAEKVALYPIAILAAWRYLEGRLSPYVLSVVIAVAALFRHDHGVYVAISMALAVLAGPRPRQDLIRVAGGTLILLLPWLVWLQTTEGIPAYVASRIDFAQDNGLGRERPFGLKLPLFTADNAAPWLWHVALFTTIAALATSIRRRSIPVIVLAGMSVVATAGLMRKAGQVGEVAAIWVPLFVWLLWTWRWYGKVALTCIAAISVVAVLTMTDAVNELTQIAKEGGGFRRRVPSALAFHMMTPPIDAYAPDDPEETSDSRLVIRYVHQCLRPSDRIWETAMWFPVTYYSQRRPVWHLHWDHGLKHDEASQRQFLEWITHEQAPVIISHSADLLEAFREYAHVRQYVMTNYREITSPRFEAYRAEGNRIWLLADIRRTPTGRFEPLDLPCFSQ